MSTTIQPHTLALLAAIGIGAVAGCGNRRPDQVQVSGRVTIDGKPLAVGTVRFISKDHRPAGAKLASDGTFTLSTYEIGDGCIVGDYAVTVMGMEEVKKGLRHWYAPKKYCSPDTSELAVKVSENTGDLEFKLTWDGKKPFDEKIAAGGD